MASKHELLLDALEERLAQNPHVDCLERDVGYAHGQLDLRFRIHGVYVYLEAKTYEPPRAFVAGERQVRRALRHGVCDQGWVVAGSPEEYSVWRVR